MTKIIITAVLSGIITTLLIFIVLYVLYKKGYYDKLIKYVVKRVINSIGLLRMD